MDGRDTEKQSPIAENFQLATTTMDRIQPHQNDVLLGRGRKIMRHPGNVKFRRLAERHSFHYVSMPTKKEKATMARSIMEKVRSMSPPGRFLEGDLEKGTWSDVGERRAMEKTAQALREAQRKSPRGFTRAPVAAASLEGLEDVDMESPHVDNWAHYPFHSSDSLSSTADLFLHPESQQLGQGVVSESTQRGDPSDSSDMFDLPSISETSVLRSVTDNDVLLRLFGKGTVATGLYRNEVRAKLKRTMPSREDVDKIIEDVYQCVKEKAEEVPCLKPDKRPVFLVPAEGGDFAASSVTLYTWDRNNRRVDWFREATLEEIQLDVYNNASPRKINHTKRRDDLDSVIEDHKIKLARLRLSQGHDPAFVEKAKDFQNDLIKYEGFCTSGEEGVNLEMHMERDKYIVAAIRNTWKALKDSTSNGDSDSA